MESHSPPGPSGPTAGNCHASAVAYLHQVYDKRGTGFGLDRTHAGCKRDLDPANLQYGEVTYEGMEPLYEALGLKNDDVFYDLGSGSGKIVLYVALRGQAAKSVGLEVGERRHELASSACTNLADQLETSKSHLPSLKQACSKMEVKLADICSYDHFDVSVVVFTNVCIDMQVQSRALNQCLKCPSFRRLVTTSPMLPNLRLKQVGSVMVSCSWAKTSCWQIYNVLPPRSCSVRSNISVRPPPPPAFTRSSSRPVRKAALGGGPYSSTSVTNFPVLMDKEALDTSTNMLPLQMRPLGGSSKPAAAIERSRRMLRDRVKSLPPPGDRAAPGKSTLAVLLSK